jgi:hypothetical protein
VVEWYTEHTHTQHAHVDLHNAKALRGLYPKQLTTHILVQVAHDLLVAAEDTYESTRGVRIVKRAAGG